MYEHDFDEPNSTQRTGRTTLGELRAAAILERDRERRAAFKSLHNHLKVFKK
jgi:hypothetical protein